jgi:hypothetical protein
VNIDVWGCGQTGGGRRTVKEGSELFTGAPWKTLKLENKKIIFNFDFKFGFKSIILVRMAFNF